MTAQCCWIYLFSKDLFSSDTTLANSARAAIAGFSWVGGVCGSLKYSVVEDYGGSKLDFFK